MGTMGFCDSYNECGKMINSAALVQALRRQEQSKQATPPRPCPARRPGNDLKTIVMARLGRMARRLMR